MCNNREGAGPEALLHVAALGMDQLNPLWEKLFLASCVNDEFP